MSAMGAVRPGTAVSGKHRGVWLGEVGSLIREAEAAVEVGVEPLSIPGLSVGRVQAERSGTEGSCSETNADGRSVAKSKGMKKGIPISKFFHLYRQALLDAGQVLEPGAIRSGE
jgi:hypothetical protein